MRPSAHSKSGARLSLRKSRLQESTRGLSCAFGVSKGLGLRWALRLAFYFWGGAQLRLARRRIRLRYPGIQKAKELKPSLQTQLLGVKAA